MCMCIVHVHAYFLIFKSIIVLFNFCFKIGCWAELEQDLSRGLWMDVTLPSTMIFTAWYIRIFVYFTCTLCIVVVFVFHLDCICILLDWWR